MRDVMLKVMLLETKLRGIKWADPDNLMTYCASRSVLWIKPYP